MPFATRLDVDANAIEHERSIEVFSTAPLHQIEKDDCIRVATSI